MTFVKYAITDPEPDTITDFAHRPAHNHPLAYDKNNQIIYSFTNTRTYHLGGINMLPTSVQVSKHDTALNLIWTRIFWR